MIPLSRGPDVVQFTRDSAERIGAVVRKVEQESPRGSPLTFAPVTAQRIDRSKKVRICTFGSAAWPKNTTFAVVTKYGTASEQFQAINLFANIGTSANTARNCAIAIEGNAWFLIAAEC